MTEDHTELNHTFCTSEENSTYSGVWECAPSRMEIESYPVHEMMTVLSAFPDFFMALRIRPIW